MNPADLDRGGKLHPIVAPRRAQSGQRRIQSARSGVRSHTLLSQATFGQSRAHGPRYNWIIRVHEVEVRARRDAVEESQVPRVLHAVPAHVRDLPAGRKPAHGARHDVEPAALAEFLARREQELIAETDPKKRPAAVERAPERAGEPEAIEIRHRVVERAVAGQHYGVRLVDAARILGDRRGHADPPERLLDRAEIPAPVIDQGNHRLASPSAAARTAAITTYPSSRAGCR